MNNESPVIFSYTRAQGIEDGVLVDCTKLAREAGFKCPVALTRAAWDLCVALSPTAKAAGNDEMGRLWDILWMAAIASRRNDPNRQLKLQIRSATNRSTPAPLSL